MPRELSIQTNEKYIIKSFPTQLNNSKLSDFTCLNDIQSLHAKFIVNYSGKYPHTFLNSMANILSKIIYSYFENVLIKKSIDTNYFYFNNNEKHDILNFCKLVFRDNDLFSNGKSEIKNKLYNYLKSNTNFNVDGFINFYLKNYIKEITTIVANGVNNYIINKEYNEFVTLLKNYISSSKSNIEIIYLVYNFENSFLIDNSGNIVPITHDVKNKYLSDISFSQNDFCLSALLNLLPKKLVIYKTPDVTDEFVTTLELIFDGRVEYVYEYYINKKP